MAQPTQGNYVDYIGEATDILYGIIPIVNHSPTQVNSDKYNPLSWTTQLNQSIYAI